MFARDVLKTDKGNPLSAVRRYPPAHEDPCPVKDAGNPRNGNRPVVHLAVCRKREADRPPGTVRWWALQDLNL